MLTLIACILTLLCASTAKARMAAVCSTHQTPRSELHCGKRNLHHAISLRRFLETHPAAGTHPDRARLRRDARWLRRYALAMIGEARGRMAPAIPHLAGWLCIHRYEGSWTDSGDPYWGGLQMDRQFMSTYAPRYLLRRGWANVWTPDEQMMVAERAFASGRGYGPWPNTRRMCGL